MSMPESNQPAIDLAETWEFLQRVEAGGSFTFQTYHDVPRGYAKDPELSEILHWPAGDITKQRQVFDRLAKVNTTLRPTDKDKLLRGAAICVMLNETDLQGRGAKNVTHIRANGSDNDTGHEDYPISPSITVESSPGHFQDWFLWNKRVADEQATADYKSVHARLIEDFHCDPNCNSGLAQVFRLPGLMHWKSGTPYLVHNAPGFRYGREELIKAFPPVGKRSAEIMTFSPLLVPDDNENQRIRDALFSVSADCGRDVWVKIGMSLEGHYGQAGEALFDEWSRTAKIAGKYNERDLKTTWRSFRGSGITIGTLFCFARDGGWEGETNRLYEEWCRKHATQKSNGDNKPTPGWSYYDGSAERKPMRWAIKNIIPEVGFGILSGQWGMFKTTAALELSLSVMTGGMFAGQYRVKRVGPVAYIALEGARMIAARLAAIAQERGVTGRLPFAWRDNCPALTDKNAAEVICGYLKEIEAQYDGQPPALVWIDTVITAAGYQSEGADNDTSATQMVMNCLSAVAKEAVGFVFGIDHFGKVIETGTRGSSAKEGAVDTIIAALGDRAVSGEVKNTRLAMRKQRDGLSGFEIPYTPRTIVTGQDEDGDVETAVIFDWGKAQQPKDTKAGWTGSLRLFWRVLTTALVDGQDYRPFSDGPLVRAVDIEAVRAEFYRQYAADGPDGQKRVAKRQAFNKALNGAQAKNLVACRESGGVQWVWVVTQLNVPAERHSSPSP